jgi:glycerophosphoryl diester phosphodiesterase
MKKTAVPAPAPRPLRAAFVALGGSLVIAACGGGGGGSAFVPVIPPAPAPAPAPAPIPLGTLDGSVPLVIGHRGLPGLFPEETQKAYEAAADAGADSLETDLHLTKDCVLVARHNPWLSDNTDITDVAKTNATVAARKRTVPGVRVDVTYPAIPANGDWSITDFTLAELKQWIHGTTFDAKDERPTDLNGKLPILSFQEVIDIMRAKAKATGRTITVYPETKNPIWNNAQAIANGCGPAGSHPLEDALLKAMNANDLNRKDAPIFVQSFDPVSLKYLRSAGLKARAVQLVDGNDIDFKTGEMIYVTTDDYTFVDGRPYSWTLAGDPRWFGAMLTPAGRGQDLCRRHWPVEAASDGAHDRSVQDAQQGHGRSQHDQAHQPDRRRPQGRPVRAQLHLPQRVALPGRRLQGRPDGRVPRVLPRRHRRRVLGLREHGLRRAPGLPEGNRPLSRHAAD